jgi:transposase
VVVGYPAWMLTDRDFRKLLPATQAELRRVAVNMVRSGKTRIEAAAAIGVNRRFVGEWVKAFEANGETALAGGKRGRRPGEQKALTPAQETLIRRLIVEKCPDQMQLPFALWTREAVGLLIDRRTGVRPSLSAISSYLAAWGFTAQKPIRRATERREVAVQAWLEQDYPAILKQAKKAKAEIHWADETGLSNQANYGRSFAPRGETPIIPRPATRCTQSMISSVTNLGTLRFMIYGGALNTAIFLRFLRRLIKNADRMLFVIVDNLRVHRAKAVTAWLAEHATRIKLFYLPPYAPERNPDEYLHNDLKQALGRGRTPKDNAAMKARLQSHMRRLQRQPAKIRSFFQAPDVRYAA